VAEQKRDAEQQESSFKVIDKRPFTSEGELRPDVVAEQEREMSREAAKEVVKEQAGAAATAERLATEKAEKAEKPGAVTPKSSAAFENLVRMIGSNAAMVLGAYADPRTGQPVIDPDAARELIDMLDALQEKTKGNLAPEEDGMLLDLLGKLKMTYLEVNQAMAAQMAEVQAKVKGGGGKIG
jgi:hypothetical protein